MYTYEYIYIYIYIYIHVYVYIYIYIYKELLRSAISDASSAVRAMGR